MSTEGARILTRAILHPADPAERADALGITGAGGCVCKQTLSSFPLSVDLSSLPTSSLLFSCRIVDNLKNYGFVCLFRCQRPPRSQETSPTPGPDPPQLPKIYSGHGVLIPYMSRYLSLLAPQALRVRCSTPTLPQKEKIRAGPSGR